tara:strand:+ start:97 stop:651 length:555 start_codon:yes stop_codon:yes gene_type:complete
MKNKLILIVFIIGLIKNIKANDITCFPSVRIGYVFSASFSMGFDLDILLKTPVSIPKTQYGINFSQTFTNVKIRRVDKGFHTTLQIKGILRTPFSDMRMGYGTVANNWGWENRSRCTTQGLAYEFSFTHPDQPFIPWVGVNIQKIKWDWEWFDTSYYQIFSKIEIPTSQPAFEKIEKKLTKANN